MANEKPTQLDAKFINALAKALDASAGIIPLEELNADTEAMDQLRAFMNAGRTGKNEPLIIHIGQSGNTQTRRE